MKRDDLIEALDNMPRNVEVVFSDGETDYPIEAVEVGQDGLIVLSEGDDAEEGIDEGEEILEGEIVG